MDPITIGLGILGAGGTFYASGQSRASAREQMRFQERMSNTSAQRAVADYRAAGLNPALAYERGASSPGGAQTTIGDPAASGIASAQRARELRLATERRSDERSVMQAQTAAARAAGTRDMAHSRLIDQQAREAMRLTNFNATMEPAMARATIASMLLNEAAVPGKQNREIIDRLLQQGLKNVIPSARRFQELIDATKDSAKRGLKTIF